MPLTGRDGSTPFSRIKTPAKRGFFFIEPNFDDGRSRPISDHFGLDEGGKMAL